jgi:Low-density lipoprotein receptor domain class A
MRAVVGANKYTGLDVVKIRENLGRQPMGIIAVSQTGQDCQMNPCLSKNGHCSELCFPSENGTQAVCSCFSNRTLLADGVSCEVGSIRCASDQFRCGNGKCIPFMLTCDLRRQCDDGSDEDTEYCKYRLCPVGFVSCKTSRYIIPDLFFLNFVQISNFKYFLWLVCVCVLDILVLFSSENVFRKHYAVTVVMTAATAVTKWLVCATTVSFGAKARATASRPSIGVTVNRTVATLAMRSGVMDANARRRRTVVRCGPVQTQPCASCRSGCVTETMTVGIILTSKTALVCKLQHLCPVAKTVSGVPVVTAAFPTTGDVTASLTVWITRMRTIAVSNVRLTPLNAPTALAFLLCGRYSKRDIFKNVS